MSEQVVVGYDTYMQTEEVFEQHRPIVAGDELEHRRRADVGAPDRRPRPDHGHQHLHRRGRERVHTLQVTVVGVTAEDLEPEIKTGRQHVMMHDVDIFGIGEEEYHKTMRPEGEVRISDGV